MGRSKKRSVTSEQAPSHVHPQQRKMRARPTPRWLVEKPDLDEIARRRCLIMLSVLSGERPVTEVIAELGISRGTYYQWEEKALGAMLAALMPDAAAPGATGMQERLAEVEAKLETAERDKRRAERLLMLTRKVMKPGPVVTGNRGRPPKARGSKANGKRASTSSPPEKKATTAPATTSTTAVAASTDGTR